MKSVLFYLLFFFSALCVRAQNVTDLPAGKYAAKIKIAQKNWERGDIIILDENRYKLSSNNEEGEYKFSVAAQRIFFISGPLKGAFTKVISANNKPIIVLPADKNGDLGLTAEVWASKQ